MATPHPEGARPTGSQLPASRASPAAAGHDAVILPARPKAGRLWQFPLLIGSVGLFAYAGYRFVDPKPPPTVDQRLAAADKLIEQEVPESAAESLRALLAEDAAKFTPDQRGHLYLSLARAIDQSQRVRGLDLPENHKRIVEYSGLAEKDGVKLDVVANCRVAASQVALGRVPAAVTAYEKAIAADPANGRPLRRKIIDLLAGSGDAAGVNAQLKTYLADANLTKAERSWALGEQSRILADRNLFAEAKTLVAEAIGGDPDPRVLGQLNYRLGYCYWKLQDEAEAERYFRLARNQFAPADLEDADAAYLLGQISQKRGKHAEAISFYQAVITNHPEATVATNARLGRGLSRVEMRSDDAGLTDLHDVAKEVVEKPARERYRAAAVAALRKAGEVLEARGNLVGALELMAAEQELEGSPSTAFFARLSKLYELRSAQVAAAAAELDAKPNPPSSRSADVARERQRARDLLAKAGDAAIALSRGLTLDDDRGYGEALWRGIDLYDRAGVLPSAISALEVFVAERPDDPLTPDALLRLGRAFHAAGRFDKAVAAFRRNQFRYPQSLAASKSGVPMARAYVAQGPAFYGQAETALRATLDSRVLTPDAEEFRDALLDLAQLYYRTERYEEAVQRLEEVAARYPKDDRKGQQLFLMADSYRKSAGLLKSAEKSPVATSAADPGTAGRDLAVAAERTAAWRDRLIKARKLYSQVIDRYRDYAPTDELDALYLKLSHFYRADCAYDQGEFGEAIRLYDAAALRYQDDPSALAAHVQIANAYVALNRPDDAKAANERARWLLKRMPPAAFKEAQQAMPQKAWDDWVTWSKTAGLW